MLALVFWNGELLFVNGILGGSANLRSMSLAPSIASEMFAGLRM